MACGGKKSTISELIEFLQDPNTLAWLPWVTLIVATLSVLTPFTLRAYDYCRHRRMEQEQEGYFRNIVHDSVDKILDVKTSQGRNPISEMNEERYKCLERMICDLKVALKDHSSCLPPEKKRDIRNICAITRGSFLSVFRDFAYQDPRLFEKHLVGKLREFKWLELDQ